MNQLHPRIQLVWILRGSLMALVLGVIGFAGHLVINLPRWLGPAIFGVVFLSSMAFIRARYRRWRYKIRDDAIYLERGVLTEVRTVIPFVRIQHVDSRRNPLERATGLASTVVYTAGTRGTDIRIPGLTPSGAEDLRERLKQLAIETEGEDAV